MVTGSIADVLASRASYAVGHCDGFALAAWLGAGAVDHVIGDPPYDEQTHAGARTMKDRGEATTIDFAPLPPLDAFLPALVGCARRWSILFCTGAMLGDYKCAAGGVRDDGGTWIREGIWRRTNGTPQITGDRPAVGCEAIAIMHAPGGRMRWNRGGGDAFWMGPRAESRKGRHPTKKPEWLMEALVRDFTDPGDLVFDPTMGEGTTGEACLKLGRRFIGCEIDPRYFAMAQERLARAAARPRQVEIGAPVKPMGKQVAMPGLT